jgi:hypothetical protein
MNGPARERRPIGKSDDILGKGGFDSLVKKIECFLRLAAANAILIHR